MKKYWLLLGVLMLLGGCSVTDGGKPGTKREEMPDPLVEVEGIQAFAKVGADIEVPVGAENARYYILSDKIAEIQFSQNGVHYSYRASQIEEQVADVQGQEAADVQAVVGDCVIPIQTAGNSHLAVWKWGGVSYGLFTDDPVDEGIMRSLVEELARETMPDQV